MKSRKELREYRELRKANFGDMRIGTYLEARKFTNTVQLLLSANKASLWIDVFGGRTPFANLEIMVRGRDRS
jgi:hypothetical protein